MRKLISYVEGLEWLYLAIFAALTFVQVQLTLAIPGYMQTITDLMQTNNGDLQALVPSGAMMEATSGWLPL